MRLCKFLLWLGSIAGPMFLAAGCAGAAMPKPETPLVVDARTFPAHALALPSDASPDTTALFAPLARDASVDAAIDAVYDVTSERARADQRLAMSPELSGRLAASIPLASLWQFAYARNAQLASAREEIAAVRHRYEQATYLYNLSGQYAAFAREQSPLEASAGAMMPTPPIFPGVLALAGELITSEVAMARIQYAMAWRDLKSDIARTYHELYLTARTIHIEEEQVALLLTLEKIARDQFKSGMVSYADVLKAQMAKAEIAADIARYRSQERSLRQRLLAALNLPPETMLAPPAEVSWQLTPDEPALRAIALDQRQELRMLALQITRSGQMVALAKAQDNLYPAFATGMSFLGRPMAASVDTTGGMNAAADERPQSMAFADRPQVEPTAAFAGRASYLAELAKTQEALRQRRANLERETGAAIAEQCAVLESGQRYVALYEQELIPLARETLQVTQLAYQSGKADFLEVLDAQRMWLQFRLEWQKNRRDCLVAIAELERLAGKSLITQERIISDE